MKFATTFRAALVGLAALAGLSTSALADGGTVVLTIYKAGGIIGGSGGSGVMNFRGRASSLSTGGLDYGLVFGRCKTVLRGRVSNINRPPASMARPVRVPRHRADQPEGRGAGAVGLPDQPDGECGSERLAITMR